MKRIFWLAGLLLCPMVLVHCADDTDDCVKFCDKVVHAEWPERAELTCTGTCYAKYLNVNCSEATSQGFPDFCVEQCSGQSGIVPCILERTCDSLLEFQNEENPEQVITFETWNAEGSKVLTIENGSDAIDCENKCRSATGSDAMSQGFADCIALADTCPELLYCQAKLQVYYK